MTRDELFYRLGKVSPLTWAMVITVLAVGIMAFNRATRDYWQSSAIIKVEKFDENKPERIALYVTDEAGQLVEVKSNRGLTCDNANFEKLCVWEEVPVVKSGKGAPSHLRLRLMKDGPIQEVSPFFVANAGFQALDVVQSRIRDADGYQIKLVFNN